MNINISSEEMETLKEKVIEKEKQRKISNDKFKFKFLKIPRNMDI